MSVAILINTTTKYLPIVDVQLTAMSRYAKDLTPIYSIYVASDMDMKFTEKEFSVCVNKIPLLPEESGFLESRSAALKYILEANPAGLDAVLMLQDDFWIDRPINKVEWDEALAYMSQDKRVKSIRLMPCPGPVHKTMRAGIRGPSVKRAYFAEIAEADQFRFTFQATLWRAEEAIRFFDLIVASAKKEFESLGLPELEWNNFCVRQNVAENANGQYVFLRNMMGPDKIHLAIWRRGMHPNAVNLATIPYRPTAVVQGVLQPWAKEFAIREGFKSLEGWY